MTASPNDRPSGGFHSVLETDHPYVFVDATNQIWPDADFTSAHRHVATAYAVTAWRPQASFEEAIRDGMEWHRYAREYEHLIVAESAESIRNAKRDGKAAFIIAAQGADWVGRELHRVEVLQRLGLRQLLFAYNATNQLAAGCHDRIDSGLTKLGELVV